MKLTRDLLHAVYSKTNGYCWYCGTEIDPFSNWQIDHQIPRSRGGRDDLSNLFPSCRACNSLKGNRDLESYRIALRAKLENRISGALEYFWEIIDRIPDAHVDDGDDLAPPYRQIYELTSQAAIAATRVPVTFYGERSSSPAQEPDPPIATEAVS